MNNEKIYTAADFASYHAGTMPAQDMHALEKAALEDPFLSDALDGYVHTNTAVADTESLREKLLPKEKSETKVVAIPSNKNWMRAAASIVIVFGLGYLFYSINKKDDTESSLADNKIQQEVKANTPIADTNKIDAEINTAATSKPQGLLTEIQTNSTPVSGNIKLDTTSLQLVDNNFSTTSGAVAQPAAPATMEAYKTEEVAADLVAKQLEKKDADDSKSKEKFKDYTLNNRAQQNGLTNYYNYNGVVQSATGGPMQNATIKLNNTNIATQTDSKGRFSFKATDSVASVSIAAVGYDKKEALLNSNFTQVLKLDNKNSNLDEVVVTGYGNKAKRSVAASSTTLAEKALAGKIAGAKTTPDAEDKFAVFKKQKAVEKDSARFNLEAKSFYNYLKENIKPELDEFGIEYEGQVILSFTVNKHGDPRDIKVVKSLNEKCDAQAKRLLESGPSWYFPKGERRTVIIEF
jgi:hypothetical protein